MKKRYLAIALMLLLLISLLLGCKKDKDDASSGKTEDNGVANSLVEEIIRTYHDADNITIGEISHDLDTTTHTDTVTVPVEATFAYMTCHYAETLVFQYDSALQTWTEIADQRDFSQTYELSESLVGTKWQGVQNLGLSSLVTYDIRIDTINQEKGWIHFTYQLLVGQQNYSGDAYFPTNRFRCDIAGSVHVIFHPENGITIAI